MSVPVYFEENPTAAIEAAFRKIEQGPMRGLPVCHAALTTELVGCSRWNEYWIGCLITPWTLQLLLLPATSAVEALQEGDVRVWEFPQGPLTFRAIENLDLGTYQSCGLCSPVTSYPSQAAIRQVSREVMELLLQPSPTKNPSPINAPSCGTGRLQCETPLQKIYTRRGFLRTVWK
jgi:[NiFe] hydrogenase assembly HybE family chaperone